MDVSKYRNFIRDWRLEGQSSPPRSVDLFPIFLALACVGSPQALEVNIIYQQSTISADEE